MYLSNVGLENIRGFDAKAQRTFLDLHRPDGRHAGWTVLAGRNGSGKTTLLRTIALLVAGPNVARILQQSFAGWIRTGQDIAIATAVLRYEEEFDHLGHALDFSPAFLMPGLTWARAENGPEPVMYRGMRSRLGAPIDQEEIRQVYPRLETVDEKSAVEIGPWSANPKGWFIAGYGPNRRLGGHALDAQRLMSGPPQVARLVNLFRNDVSLMESIQWLREIHLRRLEKREGAEQLLESVLQLVNDGLLPDSTRVMDVDSEGLWVEQRGIKLTLTDMSDGFRTTAALVVDLARQLHATYQEFKLVQQDGQWCVPYPGVVLIDEVELHLHASWQQRIGFWLKEHFPNIQFIVTTHSPFVCQAADPKGLIRLPAPGEDRTAEHVSEELYRTVVNGTVDEAVLTELFGLEHVHSSKSEQLRRRVADLEVRVLDGKASAEEQVELERLAVQLPNTGSALVDRAVRKFRLDE